MRRVCALVVATVIVSACGAAGLFRQYEYEEDVYLSLDGTATVYVNASVPALVALRGASLDVDPQVPPDRAKVREFYVAPFIHDIRVTTSRRSNRRFVHVRLDVDDVRSLSRTTPFAWSTYRFTRDGNLFLFLQQVGRASGTSVADPGWSGREIVAFRLHLPSKIEYHNAGPANPKRGNILVWEQTLAGRLRGEPLTLDARMQTQSILYRTLWLFAATFVAVATMFGVIIWWIRRRGRGTPAGPSRLRAAGEPRRDAERVVSAAERHGDEKRQAAR